MKLVPYFALGQFDRTNLSTSVILRPRAPLATLAGAWVVRRMAYSEILASSPVCRFVSGLARI